MMTRNYQVILEWDPDDQVWVTCVPSLNYLSTFGDTKEEALEHTREAILLYFDGVDEDGDERPEINRPVEIVELEVQAS